MLVKTVASICRLNTLEPPTTWIEGDKYDDMINNKWRLTSSSLSPSGHGRRNVWQWSLQRKATSPRRVSYRPRYSAEPCNLAGISHLEQRERVRCIIFLTILLPGAPELHKTWSNFYRASLAELSVIALYLLLHKQGILINLFRT